VKKARNPHRGRSVAEYRAMDGEGLLLLVSDHFRFVQLKPNPISYCRGMLKAANSTPPNREADHEISSGGGCPPMRNTEPLSSGTMGKAKGWG